MEFKVGQRVKRTNGAYGGMYPGDIGTITEIRGNSLSIKEFEGYGHSISLGGFEIVEDSPIREFKVGQKYVALKGLRSNICIEDNQHFSEGEELIVRRVDDSETPVLFSKENEISLWVHKDYLHKVRPLNATQERIGDTPFYVGQRVRASGADDDNTFTGTITVDDSDLVFEVGEKVLVRREADGEEFIGTVMEVSIAGDMHYCIKDPTGLKQWRYSSDRYTLSKVNPTEVEAEILEALEGSPGDYCFADDTAILSRPHPNDVTTPDSEPIKLSRHPTEFELAIAEFNDTVKCKQ